MTKKMTSCFSGEMAIFVGIDLRITLKSILMTLV